MEKGERNCAFLIARVKYEFRGFSFPKLVTHLLSGLRVEHIPNSISLYVRSLVPYISDTYHYELNSERMEKGERNYAFLIFTLTLHRVHSCARPNPCHIV